MSDDVAKDQWNHHSHQHATPDKQDAEQQLCRECRPNQTRQHRQRVERELHPALDLWESSTTARENFLSAQELDAVKARRRTLKGDAEVDITAAIEAKD